MLFDWLQEVRKTQNEQDLLSLAREYLANWYHGDLAEIAEDCRPTRIRDADDLHYWSERLAEGFCKGGALGSRPDLHREMLAFFVEAARRADELPSAAAKVALSLGRGWG
jgi:hypothetical protein